MEVRARCTNKLVIVISRFGSAKAPVLQELTSHVDIVLEKVRHRVV